MIPKITLYDTLVHRGRQYVVVGETEKDYILKEISFQFTNPVGGGRRSKLSKEDYYSGSSGYRRIDLPRVTVSYLKA